MSHHSPFLTTVATLDGPDLHHLRQAQHGRPADNRPITQPDNQSGPTSCLLYINVVSGSAKVARVVCSCFLLVTWAPGTSILGTAQATKCLRIFESPAESERWRYRDQWKGSKNQAILMLLLDDRRAEHGELWVRMAIRQ